MITPHISSSHPLRRQVFYFNDCKYMKIMYVNCGWRNEYGSDPHSYGHYLSSIENKAWI